MKNVFIDATSFKYTQEISQALRIYLLNRHDLTFNILGRKNDFITIMHDKNINLIEDLTPVNLQNLSDEQKEMMKDEEKVDYNKELKEKLINENDLIITSKDFSSFFIHDEDIIIRPYNKDKKDHSYVVELNKNVNYEKLVDDLKDIIKLYNLKLKNDRRLKIYLSSSYNNDETLNEKLKFFSEYEGILPINEVLSTSFDILILDNTSSFYFYSLLNSLSDDNKKDQDENSEKKKKKSVLDFLKKEKSPIEEINTDSLFSFYIIKIDKNNKYTFYLRNFCNANSFFTIFDKVSSIL